MLWIFFYNTHSTNSQCSTILLSNIIHNKWLQYSVNPWKTTQQLHNTHTHTHTVSTTEQKQVRHQTTPHMFFQQNYDVLTYNNSLEQSLKDSIEYTLPKIQPVFLSRTQHTIHSCNSAKDTSTHTHHVTNTDRVVQPMKNASAPPKCMYYMMLHNSTTPQWVTV